VQTLLFLDYIVDMIHIGLNKVIRPNLLRVAEEDCWKSKLVLRIINKY